MRSCICSKGLWTNWRLEEQFTSQTSDIGSRVVFILLDIELKATPLVILLWDQVILHYEIQSEIHGSSFIFLLSDFDVKVAWTVIPPCDQSIFHLQIPTTIHRSHLVFDHQQFILKEARHMICICRPGLRTQTFPKYLFGSQSDWTLRNAKSDLWIALDKPLEECDMGNIKGDLWAGPQCNFVLGIKKWGLHFTTSLGVLSEPRILTCGTIFTFAVPSKHHLAGLLRETY